MLLRTIPVVYSLTGEWQYRVAIMDISQRERVEQALHESEYRYRTLFDSIDEGFCIIEMIFDENEKPIDYRFLEVNQSFEKQTELRDAQGKTVLELAPKHEAHWFEIYGRIALTGEPARFEHRAEQLGGWYDVYAFRFGPPQDHQVAVLFNDITARKRTEDALRESQQRLALAASGTGIGMFDWNIATGKVAANEQKTRLVGLTTTLSQVYHRSEWIECVHPDDRARVQAHIHRTVTEHAPYELEYRVVWPDGRVRWLSTRGVLCHDEQGQLQRVLGVTMDITEQRRNKHELERQVHELNAANEELARFNRAVVDRELRMIQLKREINELCAEAGQPRRYPLAFEKEDSVP